MPHDPLRWLDQHEARMVLRLEWPPLLDKHFTVLCRAIAKKVDYDFYLEWVRPDGLYTSESDGTWNYWRKPLMSLRQLLGILAENHVAEVRGYWVPTGWRNQTDEEGNVCRLGDTFGQEPVIDPEDWFTVRLPLERL